MPRPLVLALAALALVSTSACEPPPQAPAAATARAAAVADTLWRLAGPAHLSGAGRRIEVPQSGRIDLARGTLVLLFTPAFDADDGSIKRDLFGTGEWRTPGSLGVGKHNASNGTGLYLMWNDAAGRLVEHLVRGSDYGWRAGDTVALRVTWDLSTASGPHIRVYQDGAELPVRTRMSQAPYVIPPGNGTFYVGGRHLQDGGDMIWAEMTVHAAFVLSEPVGPSVVEPPCPPSVPG